MDGEGLIKELDQDKDTKLSFVVRGSWDAAACRCLTGPLLQEYSAQYKPQDMPEDDEEEEEGTEKPATDEEGDKTKKHDDL